MPDIPVEISSHVAEALQLLEQQDSKKLSTLLEALHPVELVAVINSVDDSQQAQLLKHVTGLDQLSDVIAHANEHLRRLTLELIDESRIAAVIRRLEVDDAADILSGLSRRRQLKVLRRLSAHTVKELTSLLAYNQDTAGRIMTTRYLSFRPETSANEAITELRQRLRDRSIDDDTDLHYAYLLDESESLRGVLSLRRILSAEPDQRLSELADTEIITIFPDEDQEIAARLIKDYDLSAIPVVSVDRQHLLGIITVDDVLDVIEDEHTEDLLRLAGTEDQDTVGATLLIAVRSRFPWLVASWLGGIGGALLLGSFSSTLEKLVALAFFMPVVFGMGGNVGSQASTITVRGLATGDLGQHRIAARLQKESLVGLMLGISFGILLAMAAYLLFGQVRLSAIVGVSIMTTMVCAAALGSMLPICFQRLGFDPAVASGPLVTTTTDILSISIYFSVASLLLGS